MAVDLTNPISLLYGAVGVLAGVVVALFKMLLAAKDAQITDLKASLGLAETAVQEALAQTTAMRDDQQRALAAIQRLVDALH
jgi:cyanate lyase